MTREKALTQYFSKDPCTDAVSREAVYSILKEYHIDEEEIESAMDERQNLTVNGIASDVSFLPSVKQKSKTGHWIIHPKGIYAHLVCDRCLSNAPYDCRTNYCPNCGTNMESEE